MIETQLEFKFRDALFNKDREGLHKLTVYKAP